MRWIKKKFKEKILRLPLDHRGYALAISFIPAFLGASLLGLVLWMVSIDNETPLSLRFLFIPAILCLLFWSSIYTTWKAKAIRYFNIKYMIKYVGDPRDIPTKKSDIPTRVIEKPDNRKHHH